MTAGRELDWGKLAKRDNSGSSNVRKSVVGKKQEYKSFKVWRCGSVRAKSDKLSGQKWIHIERCRKEEKSWNIEHSCSVSVYSSLKLGSTESETKDEANRWI